MFLILNAGIPDSARLSSHGPKTSLLVGPQGTWGFGLNSSVNVANKSKGQYSIYIPKKDLNLLRELVTPYFLPTFLYKLGISEK